MQQSPRAVERYRFALSEREPIHVLVNTHEADTDIAPYDMHFELELGIVLGGSMRRLFLRHQRVCHAGDLWCCGMWEPHGYEALELPCEVLVLLIWPPLLVNLHFAEAPDLGWMTPFTLPPAQRPTIAPAARGTVIEIGRRLAALAPGAEPVHAVQRHLLALELLTYLQRPAKEAPSPAIYHQLSPAIERVFTSRTLVTTAAAAEICLMSEDAFSRSFQALMGLSFARFALRHRIHGAAGELAGTDHPVKAVAQRWGFTDESHLHRLFLKHYGCSPAAYRRREQG